MLSLTDRGDRVFDPYMGVGSTVIAAVMHGRDGYGCDTEPSYAKTAEERIQSLRQGNLRLRPMSRRVLTPNTRKHAAASAQPELRLRPR